VGEGQRGDQEGEAKCRDLLADERCSPVVLDFMRSIYIYTYTHVDERLPRWRKIGIAGTRRRKR